MAASNSKGERPVVLVTAARVNDVKFTSGRYLRNFIQRGYDEDEVDDFLDEVIATLEYYEKAMEGGNNANRS